jgi:hypothetical protein
MSIFGTYLCIHKKTCIYIGTLVSSSKIFQFDRRVTQAGTIANDTIVNLPSGQQVFLAEDGIRLFNGVTAPLIESPINDEIRDGLNKEYIRVLDYRPKDGDTRIVPDFWRNVFEKIESEFPKNIFKELGYSPLTYDEITKSI